MKRFETDFNITKTCRGMISDAKELMDHISELEDKLRWRNIGEEKPPEYDILLKGENRISPYAKMTLKRVKEKIGLD